MASYTPGTYEGAARGYGGKLFVLRYGDGFDPVFRYRHAHEELAAVAAGGALIGSGCVACHV